MELGRLLSARTAPSPDGRQWTIGIHWLPRQPTWMGWGLRGKRARKKSGEKDGGAWELLQLVELGEAHWVVFALIAAALLLLLLWFVILPIAIFLFDLLFVLLLALGAVALRVLFKRPWIVEAATADEVHRFPVVGWGASRRAVQRLAQSLTRDGTFGALADRELREPPVQA